MAWQLMVLLVVSAVSFSSATVFLERVPMGTICPGSLVTYTCAVDNGILSWRDGNGNPLGSIYLANTSPGSIQSVNGFTLNLTSVDVNNLISTATITPATSGMIALRCTNTIGGTNSSSVNVRSISSISVTTLSTVENEVNFSWPVPDRTCCDQFRVMLSNVTVATTNQTEYRFSNLDFDVEVYASVRCVSENVFEGIPSEPRAILNTSQLIDLDFNRTRTSLCTDENVMYEAIWSIEQPSTDQVFTPELLPNVTCFYGSNLSKPPMSVAADQRVAVCQYTRAEVALGSISVSINGVNSFGYSEMQKEFSINDGNECRDALNVQRIFILGLSVGLSSGLLLICIGLLVVVVLLVVLFKWKKKTRQQLGTEMNRMSEKTL